MSEHLLFSHPYVKLLLSHLFQIMLKYEIVPTGFERGVVIPV
jgi:hypothetical protein